MNEPACRRATSRSIRPSSSPSSCAPRGGVLAALAQGIPLVVAGGDLDKPEIAARVAWAGAGVNLRTGRPRPRAIRRAWRRVSADASYRANAQRLAESLAAHDGPREVVEQTMALLARRRVTGPSG